ncbi:MAG: tetratricopeptide repeat protein [Flavobacteriales bacterium]
MVSRFGRIKPDSGVYYGYQWLNSMNSQTTDSLRSRAHNLIGVAFDIKGEADSALKHLRKTLRLRETSCGPSFNGNTYQNIGICYYFQGMYDSSLVYYQKALDLHEQGGSLKGQAMDYNNIGLIYRTQEQYKKAKEYYHRSIRVKRALNDQHALLKTYSNLSAISQYLEEPDSALFYSNLILEYALVIKDTAEIATAFDGIGDILFRQERYEESIPYLEKAVKFFGLSDGYEVLPLSMKHLADAYSKVGRKKEALKQYEDGLSMARQRNLKEVELDIMTSLIEYHSDQNDYKSAFELQQQYHKEREEIFGKERATTIDKLSVQYETEKKEKEIALLNAERVGKEAELNSKNAQRNLFLGLSLATMILLVVGGFLFARISTKNQQIELALDEKGVLLREIHHRVKNNLQMISSLLSLQSRYVKDDTASKALKDSRNRVTSVTLIHQRLYQEDNLTGVLMREYVPELVGELLSTVDSDNIEVEQQIDNLNLDIDTVIPLGLVLNELITNVLKYATGGANDLLKVSLIEKEEKLILSVTDNGPGVPVDFDPKKTASYGVKLIKSLSRKLEAEVEYNNQNPGLEVRVTIHKYKHAV